jgi:hypothetical protein
MKSTALIFLMICAGPLASAQILSPATDTLRWESNGFDNLSNQETVTHESTFTTGTNSIVWDQLDGESTYTFTVLSQQGEWNNVSQDGSTVFTVNKGSSTGTLTFQRVNGELKVSMEFIKNGVNVMPYVFTVSAVTKI